MRYIACPMIILHGKQVEIFRGFVKEVKEVRKMVDTIDLYSDRRGYKIEPRLRNNSNKNRCWTCRIRYGGN